jgi:hypothetical protein
MWTSAAIGGLVLAMGLGACGFPGIGPAALQVDAPDVQVRCLAGLGQPNKSCSGDAVVTVTNSGGRATSGPVVLTENAPDASFPNQGTCDDGPLDAGASCTATLQVQYVTAVGDSAARPGTVTATSGAASDSDGYTFI